MGTLKYDDNHFIHRATAKTAEKEWVFKYTRLSLPKVTIQKGNSLVAQAIIDANWGGQGTVIFPCDRRYTWKSTGYTENEFCFLTPDHHPIVFFRPYTGLLKIEAEVEIDPAASHHPNTPLLSMLGWFLVLLRLC